MMPDRTLHFKGKLCIGGKESNERITVLLAANMPGNRKLKPLISGKSQNPRCFQGVRHLPVTYRANKKAWMTGELWMEWIHKLDESMRLKNRHILLLIDNCSAHKEVANLTNISRS
jgi:hypothetical protein